MGPMPAPTANPTWAMPVAVAGESGYRVTIAWWRTPFHALPPV